jgi:hypothetical protein
VKGDGPPPGWVALMGTVEAGSRVCDYAARGQTVKGACRTKGCYRRVEMDPEALVREGQGTLAMRKLQPSWKCHRLEGCEMQFVEEPPTQPLRLGHFTGLPHVRVRLTCRGEGCKFARVYPAAALIKGLKARRQGDERTEIGLLPDKMTAGCPRCKVKYWAADVLWMDTSTVGWRSQGEANFARYETG